MKYGTPKAKNRDLFGGRNILLAIVVLTSSLSFTLGYFVGKAVVKEPQPQIAQEISEDAAAGISEEIVPAGEKTDNGELQSPAHEDVLTVQKEKVSLPAQNPAIKEERPSAKATSKENKPAQDEIIYTLQAGAFKNLNDALALKHKLENKGYKTHIKKTTDAKNMKLFKVRMGEFKDRSKAEAAAIKLKKEGLKAFVVMSKTETAGETDKMPRTVKQEKTRLQ